MSTRIAGPLAFGIALLLAIVVGIGTFPRVWHKSGPTPNQPLYAGIGTYRRAITTRSQLAQSYFDQGLAFLYGFNHEEAVRSFRAAATADPSCPMAYWGIAAACGPDINYLEVDPLRAKEACEAIARVREVVEDVTPAEQGLIEAIAKRYSVPEPQNQLALNESYAAAMGELWKAFPADPDIGALRADSLVILAACRRRTLGVNSPGENREAIRTLDTVLANSPKHLLALHLTIHMSEGAAHPERASAAAHLLRDLAPGIGHLVHMPSHIDVRLGQWHEAVVANEKAIAADHAYRRSDPRTGSQLLYMSHSHHMLAYAAMMEGRSNEATAAAEEMLGQLPERSIKNHPDACDGLFGVPYELHLRFGRWDAMLAEREPRLTLRFTTALWHYARAVSFAAKLRVSEAKAEQQAFATARDAVPTTLEFRRVPATQLLSIAEKMLAGEILYREAKAGEAVRTLREAVKLEDNLEYSEPPAWIFPVRHALGATLLDAGRYAEAETVYRDDLIRHPENGWSLFGLQTSLRRLGKNADADAIAARFQKAWRFADTNLTSSCFCLPAKNP